MRVLIVKTSSLGDIVHTFPALSDALQAIPDLRFDWVVEETYADIPLWHPAVDQVISTAMRRWRTSWLETWLRGDWKVFVRKLQRRRYDAVIDAQGLLKSAMITRKALGVKHGLDSASARESQASRFYDLTHPIGREQHAIERTRQLFARALGYDYQPTAPDYGLALHGEAVDPEQYVIFLHGSAWASKRWPIPFWQGLRRQAEDAGYKVVLPAGSEEERKTAWQIAEGSAAAEVLPATGLNELAHLLGHADGVVAVDTGLAHVAAAVEAPIVSLYGATSTGRTGVVGKVALAMQSAVECSPCYQRQCGELRPGMENPPCTESWAADEIWARLEKQMEAGV